MKQDQPAQQQPQQLGNYRLIRRIGQGGFATVYLGRHIHLQNYAAIKVLHTRFGTMELIEQFRKEAQTIAELAHPHIVRVLDFDVEEDIAFFVMDYAPFGSLRRQYKLGTIVPLPAVISYVKQLASALHYAHQHRIIHRDVKPENMLIGRSQEILLSDFGIALLAETMQRTGEPAGTITYIAPEQINGRPQPASDQYALAVTVYEWLCGESPFTGTMTEVVAKHLSASPPPLRTHVPDISPSVERVVLRALAKDPAQRFPTIQGFASALEKAAGVEPRALEDEHFTTIPIGRETASSTLVLQGDRQQTGSRELASALTIRQQRAAAPPPASSRVQRPMIPRRAILFGVLALVGASGAGIAFATLQHAPTASPAQQQSMATQPSQAITPTTTPGTTPTNQPPTPTPNPTPTQAQASAQPQPAQQPAPNPTPAGTLFSVYRGHTNAVYSVAWSPDGMRIVSGGADKTAQIWHAADGGNILTYSGHAGSVNYVAWSPDGTRIVSASDDKTVQVWDAVTGSLLFTCTGHASSVHSAVFSPDGKRIASGSTDNTVKVWDATNGALLMTYRDHTASIWAVAWSPDSTRIASASGSPGVPDHTVKVWNVVTGATITTYTGHTDTVVYTAWSPNGRRIASGSFDTTVQVWDAATGATQLTYRGHSNTVYGVAWSPGGGRIASGSVDTMATVWNVVDNSTFTYHGHTSFVFGVSWSPDGTRIASASDDRTVQVWQA